MLKKYGISELSNGSNDVKKQIKNSNLIEDVDYLVCRLADQSDTSRGIKYSNVYMFHPDGFKKLLIRSKNTNKYTNYYILLERCIKNFNDYQNQINETMLRHKDVRIDDLSRQVQELLAESRDARNRLTASETRLSDVEDELVNTSDNLESTMVSLSIVQDKLEIAVEDRAVKPFDKSKVNQIAILRSKEYNNMYYLSCGQKDSVNRATRLRHKSHALVDTILDVPNSIYLFDHVKKQLGTRVTAISRTFQLISIDEPNFLDEIHSLFDGRRNVDLTKRP